MRRRTVLALGLVAALVWAVVPAVATGRLQVVTSAEPIDYVALGDSYGAGPLVPEVRSDPFGCGRSTNNYPAYLAGYLEVATYRDVSCSGARSRHLRRSQAVLFGGGSNPPQLDALSSTTDLVTLGIGGNDFGLFGEMIVTCTQLREGDPDGSPCRDHFLRRIDGDLVDTKLRDARRIRDHLSRALRGIHVRAPEASVYVVGYPRLLPTVGTCDAVPFAAGDYEWGRRVERVLNRSLRRAAEGGDATYVDLYPATRGHDACAGADAWINGSRTVMGVAAAFHPLQAGMRGAAEATYAAITGLSAPEHEDAQPPPGSVVVNPAS